MPEQNPFAAVTGGFSSSQSDNVIALQGTPVPAVVQSPLTSGTSHITQMCVVGEDTVHPLPGQPGVMSWHFLAVPPLPSPPRRRSLVSSEIGRPKTGWAEGTGALGRHTAPTVPTPRSAMPTVQARRRFIMDPHGDEALIYPHIGWVVARYRGRGCSICRLFRACATLVTVCSHFVLVLIVMKAGGL